MLMSMVARYHILIPKGFKLRFQYPSLHRLEDTIRQRQAHLTVLAHQDQSASDGWSHAIYNWIYDCHAEIAYIGITNGPLRREGEHYDRDVMYKYECAQCTFTFQVIKTFSTRRECRERELEEIRKPRLLFNDQDNPDLPDTS